MLYRLDDGEVHLAEPVRAVQHQRHSQLFIDGLATPDGVPTRFGRERLVKKMPEHWVAHLVTPQTVANGVVTLGSPKAWR